MADNEDITWGAPQQQHEDQNGKGHSEFALANPTTLSNEVAKNPAPSMPSGLNSGLMSMLMFIYYRMTIMRLKCFFYFSQVKAPLRIM